jgi:phosphoribosylaminoimidazolecarboxamide formyltransferase/IMP cyclohydrolase
LNSPIIGSGFDFPSTFAALFLSPLPHMKICSALLSVYHKDGLEEIVRNLHSLEVQLFATGGTFDFIKNLSLPVTAVEDITGYPSILDGRVKTLHPAVFGGILAIREDKTHQAEMEKYKLPFIDLVVVDLYPFEATVNSGASREEIIEKIDIGGISLIRGAAKNFQDVLIIPSVNDYALLNAILKNKKGISTLEQRQMQAERAFGVSSSYDTAIHKWFAGGSTPLRYGENPHQKGAFEGDLREVFEQLHGKELSYNNLLDVDASLLLINEFTEPAFAVIKHNNACGMATDAHLLKAWEKALAGDPVSAFGGVLATNRTITVEVAEKIDSLFFEILMAPAFEPEALTILQKKKNRILLATKTWKKSGNNLRSVLNGVLIQEADLKTETESDLKVVTKKAPTHQEISDLIFANILVKHTKSNAIVLAKNGQLLGSGAGQTSRVDALQQAIAKAKHFGFDLSGAVMASDAFFPFPDCVQISAEAGISAIVQPGGSVRDIDSIEEADKLGLSMVVTGTRHFRH